MDTIVQIHTSYTQYWASNIHSKVQAPLIQVHHQMRVWGNGEEGMRELLKYCNFEIYSRCIDFNYFLGDEFVLVIFIEIINVKL